jgi:Calx-beta domain
MSNRSQTANAGQPDIYGRRPHFCAGALVLAMAWGGVPGAACADAIFLQNGESIDGSIVDATRNTVIVRRAMGGMRQMPIQDIAGVRLDLAEGEPITGQFLRWVEGVHEVRSGGDLVRISAGRILTRERHDPATTPPPSLLPRPLLPQPGEEPAFRAAGPTTTAPEDAPAEFTRAQAVAAEVAPAKDPAAVASAANISGAEDSPAVAAPTPVGPTRTAAAPGGVARIVNPVAEGGIADIIPAEVSAATATPAAVAVPEAAPAVAVPSAASTAKARIAKTAAAEATSQPEAGRDDQRIAVRGTIGPAEAGAGGIVFRIELSRPADQPVVLIYGTVDGTAQAGRDYEPQQGLVTLTPGSRSADLRVPLIGHPHPRDVGFELFLMADPKVANVIDQRIAATIPAAD